KGFAFGPAGEIDRDDAFDGIGHRLGWQARPQPLTDRRMQRRIAAKRDLIAFGAALFEAKDPDAADMMMAAGIDTAGNFDAEFADHALPIGVVKPLRDRLC